MSSNWGRRVLTLGLALLGLAMTASGIEAGEVHGSRMSLFTVTIKTEGLSKFDASCSAFRSGGEEEVVTQSGSASWSHKFNADRVRCDVIQTSGEGGIEVILTSPNGNTTRSKTSGMNSRVSIGLS